MMIVVIMTKIIIIEFVTHFKVFRHCAVFTCDIEFGLTVVL